MLSRSTWLHLRIPFSYFLLPVYLFALGISPNLNAEKLLWSFVIIHLLLYPASNAFNSYFDKDVDSIALLKRPPQVTKQLYFVSLLLDVAAIVLSLIYINKEFAILVLIYGLISKAYSHPSVRLKKYPFISWGVVVLFQGCFSFLMCYEGINALPFESLVREKVITAGLLTSLMLCGSYPLTQVYQHEEDKRHGDTTLSMLLGIRGTFYFSTFFFVATGFAYLYFFNRFFQVSWAYTFLLALLPMLIFFLFWFTQVLRNSRHASYSLVMWQNFISATCLNAFFIYFFLETSHILQL